MFRPHLSCETTWPSTISLTENKIDAILESKRWIRSVVVAAQHIERISSLGLTTLQELVLYDQNFQASYIGDPVSVDAVIYMIGSNKSLWSLAIDLNRYNYKSQQLAPALLLAIARHPSLTKLTWHIPDHLDTRAFIQCLLHVCHDSIQELYLAAKCNVFIHSNGVACQPFTHEDFYRDQNVIKRSSKDRVLLQKLKAPIDLLEEPFKFKTLWLRIKPRQDILLFLRNCPQLENIRIEDILNRETCANMPQFLADHCTLLRRVDLRNAWGAGEAIRCSTQLRRFSQLQRVYVPFTDYRLVSYLMRGLERSSRMSLEVLCMPPTEIMPPKFVLALLTKFPHLKEIDFGTVKIFILDTTGCPRTSTTATTTTMGTTEGALHLQSKDDLESEDAITEDWDPLQGHRPLQNMDYWWFQWMHAKEFMKRVQGAYEQASQEKDLPLIRMKFMYPIKYFVPRHEALAYANCTGAWKDGRRSWTIEDVRRNMRNKGPHDPETHDEGDVQVTENLREETTMAKITKSVTEWWK